MHKFEKKNGKENKTLIGCDMYFYRTSKKKKNNFASQPFSSTPPNTYSFERAEVNPLEILRLASILLADSKFKFCHESFLEVDAASL